MSKSSTIKGAWEISGFASYSQGQGTWETYGFGPSSQDLIIKYQGRSRVGRFAYAKFADKRSRALATVWLEKDQDGQRDSNEKIIAVYKANYYAFQRFGPVETGRFKADRESGKFKLVHEGYAFAKGRITDLDYFFG